jgi:hypothetical protein
MTKGIFSFLLILGFLIFLLGAAFWSWGGSGLAFLGILLMLGAVGGAYYFGVIRSEDVIENWSILVEEGSGKANDILEGTSRFLEESGVKNIAFERRLLAPGVIKEILGEKREFLAIEPLGSIKLKPYKIFLNARDYGKNLHVSWYLTYRVGFIKALLSLIPGLSWIPKVLSDLDLFEQQDLIAYVTNAHHCTLKAVEKLMLNLKQDPSKIDRRTRGFLGVS